MMLTNAILHITLPVGLKTTDGAILRQPVTFDIASMIDPFYASVEQVKLVGGMSLRNLSDITLAGQIYMASKAVDMMNFNPPHSPTSHEHFQFINARNLYVAASAAKTLILSMGDLLGPGTHVLANFSVSKTRNSDLEGTAAKLNDLSSTIKLYDPTIRSGGKTAPGGYARPLMAAKGVFDWQERTPSRLWIPNGGGANMTAPDMGSSTGGRGKSMKYYATPMISPSLCSMRMGVYQSGLSLSYLYTFPAGLF